MRIKLTLFVCLLLLAKESLAQNNSTNFFLGINPSITVEPFYDTGELDVNILPLVLQIPLHSRIDLRISSILNLGIRKATNKISHVGAEIAVPIFLKNNADKILGSSGFYAAPVLSFTRNQLHSSNVSGFWLEPGYAFRFDNDFSLSLGLQFGTTLFSYEEIANEWGGHFGVKVIFGKWI